MQTLTLLIASAALILAGITTYQLAQLRQQLNAKASASSVGNTSDLLPDPWIDSVREWLATSPQVSLTTDAILAGALPGTASTRQASARITTVMKALGYRATRVRLPGQETLARVFQRQPVVSAQP